MGRTQLIPVFHRFRKLPNIFGYLGALIIVDHGDGTWSAIDEADTYITMLDDTTFQIDDADATYIWMQIRTKCHPQTSADQVKEVKWLQLRVLLLTECWRSKTHPLLMVRLSAVI